MHGGRLLLLVLRWSGLGIAHPRLLCPFHFVDLGQQLRGPGGAPNEVLAPGTAPVNGRLLFLAKECGRIVAVSKFAHLTATCQQPEGSVDKLLYLVS